MISELLFINCTASNTFHLKKNFPASDSSMYSITMACLEMYIFRFSVPESLLPALYSKAPMRTLETMLRYGMLVYTGNRLDANM